jgi:hypothetical protein
MVGAAPLVDEGQESGWVLPIEELLPGDAAFDGLLKSFRVPVGIGGP